MGTSDGTADWWRGWVGALMGVDDSSLSKIAAQNLTFLPQVIKRAYFSLFTAAGTLALLGYLLYLIQRASWALYGIAVLAVLEVYAFAFASRASFDISLTRSSEFEQFRKSNPGDYRIFNPSSPNFGMSYGVSDIWGSDPGVSLRYAEFIAYTQHQNPDTVTQSTKISGPHKLFRMLRLNYVILPYQNQFQITKFPNPMGHLELIYDLKVVSGRDQIFSEMDKVNFDPSKTVILETQPNPFPVLSAQEQKGTIRLLDSSTDSLTIEADLQSAAVLLITDVYSHNWHARALEGSVQSTYKVMPANYTLMGVPLAAGHHHFEIQYMPESFQVGKWISIASLVLFLIVLGWDVKKRAKLRSMARS